MFFRKTIEPEQELTAVWKCTNDICGCFMREGYSFQTTPSCPMCESEMYIDEKLLPVLNNSLMKV